MKNRVIINADDFGISPRVNRAICECFKKGYITSTTLMANMPYAEEAMKMAKDYGFIDSVGIHLNFTEGPCMYSECQRYSIISNGDSNSFSGDFHRKLNSRVYLSAAIVKALMEEMKLQVCKYIELGGTNMHLDSHHHVHTDPALLSVLNCAIDRFGIKSIRLSRNLNISDCSYSARLYKKLFNDKITQKCGFTTNYFGSFMDFYSDSPKNNLIEIMCHPDYSDDSMNMLIDLENPLSYEGGFDGLLKRLGDYEFAKWN